VLKPPPFDEFLVLPLRVHLLSATDLPEIDCKLSDFDVNRIIGKVNRIWNNAGIHWGVESIVREPAARQSRFRLTRDLDGPRSIALYRMLIPESHNGFAGLHIYYMHTFTINGVWMGSNFAIIQDSARLNEVEGGIDEPIPRVTAHELGHALGLPHRQNRTNLLASGTTGTQLNTSEAEAARKRAREIKGVRSVAELKAAASEADCAGDGELARKLWSWLREIPGSGEEPRQRLDRLKRATKTKDRPDSPDDERTEAQGDPVGGSRYAESRGGRTSASSNHAWRSGKLKSNRRIESGSISRAQTTADASMSASS
jgi:hypothetical protein